MYWAGRYLERAENTARLVNTYAGLLLDLPLGLGVGWAQILPIVGAQQAFEATGQKATEEAVLRFLVADPENPGSIVSSLSLARENIRTSRDVVPTEGWECVNELYLVGRRRLGGAVGRRRRFETLSDCVVRCQQITGLLSGTMSHGDAYNFLRTGNYLERADMTTRVVDVAAATLAQANPALEAYENTLWMAVLRSMSAYQMYRRHVRRRVAAQDVVWFLLTDSRFPRSVTWALASLDRCIASFPRAEGPRGVLSRLQQDALAQSELDAVRLHDDLDRLQLGLGALHGAIESCWFLPR